MTQSLTQWLAYIESLHPENIKLGLERVKTVATSLKIFPEGVKIFTIAGTNGKGSTATFLAAILQNAGYATAVYTSPHLLRFNERIRINGIDVSEAELIEAFEAVEKGRGDVSLTYFEFTTLAAFLLFKQTKLDVWILEVGLGGRLDAVNIIDPDVAIITTIALDHMDWLGDDREKIGWEKAGIMRKGIPVVCGDSDPPDSISKAAQTCGANLYCLGRDFTYDQTSDETWSWRRGSQGYTNLPMPDLPLQNAATALIALTLSGLEINREAFSKGLKQARLMGRFQVFSKPINTILDVAHNPQSAQYLADRLSKIPFAGTTRAVVGILKDKDIPGILRPLLPHIDRWYVGGLEVPRGETAENMANYLHNLGVSAYDTHTSVTSAFQAALDDSLKTIDRIVVFGSFYTAGEIMILLRE